MAGPASLLNDEKAQSILFLRHKYVQLSIRDKSVVFLLSLALSVSFFGQMQMLSYDTYLFFICSTVCSDRVECCLSALVKGLGEYHTAAV